MIDAFLGACGATGPLVLGTESAGAHGVETRAFDLPFVLAGGDPRSDLRLNHPDVSDRHAYLQLVDGQLVCIDLGSRVGIYQGGKCQRLAYLERGQAARVGPFRVRLLGGDAGPGAGLARPINDAPCPPLPLALSHRGARDSRCELPRGLALVGSASDCQVRLVDPSVSNYHASLVHTPGGTWVVDLLGQGGVRVNGREVAYAQIHEGDSLQLGHSVLRIPTAAEAEAVAVVETEDRGPQVPATLTDELVDRVLGPIASQVGLLQRQMAEEFQQSRAMLFETFATLQQEQTAFLNQELDQVRQLSAELHALRADLERQTRLLAEQVALASASASASAPTRLGAATSSTPRPAAPAPPPLRAESFPVVVTRHNLNGHAGSHTPPPTSSPSHRHEATADLVRAHNEDAHARLCKRIARLQAKRQTRWEKLMSLFPGGAPGKSTT